MKREPPLVKILPRQTGTKESRYAHLLSADVEIAPPGPSEAVHISARSGNDRVAKLEEELTDLRNEITDLKRHFAEFRKQFE